MNSNGRRWLVFLFILLVAILLFVLSKPRATKTSEKEKKRKRVRFRPRVEIASAGGKKEDRFNPELERLLRRNILAAQLVGGTRRLAEMTLQNA